MSERRFTDKPALDPSAVWGLAADHPAMLENRTLFPSTVVTVDEAFEGRLLVSGENSRKLGKTIEKGKFKGYGLYSLTLEERATCATTCEARSFCYGSSMQQLVAALVARQEPLCEPFTSILRDKLWDLYELDGGAEQRRGGGAQ